MDKREQIMQAYPWYYNDSLPTELPCAFLNTNELAERAFFKICPKGMYVDEEVCSVRTYIKPYCQWTVTFIQEDSIPEGDEAKEAHINKVLRYCPMNAYVMESTFSYGPPVSVYVTYGVRCDCPEYISEEEFEDRLW